MVTLATTRQSGFLIIDNEIEEKVERIAAVSPFQVGRINDPVELQLSGGFVIKVVEIDASGGQTYETPLQTVCLYVKLSGTGNVSINLPKEPFSGQLIIIKDVLGTASRNPIIISGQSGHLIDGSSSVTMNTNHEALQLVWNEGRWSTICCGAGGGGVSVAGADTQVQFNDGGTSLGAEAEFVYNKTNYLLNVGQAQVGRWNGSVNDYAVFKDKDSATNAYALLQNAAGKTFLNAASGQDVEFRNNNSKIGSLSNNVVELTGQSGTATSTTIGNTTGASTTTIQAGTGNVQITSDLIVNGGNATVNGTALLTLSPTSTDIPLLIQTPSAGNTLRWGIGIDTGYDLGFYQSFNNTTLTQYGYLADGVSVGNIDFTGQHRSYPSVGTALDFLNEAGLIVVAAGQYKCLSSGSTDISINEALPLVALSTKRNQKSVFGVISSVEDPNENERKYLVGNWGSTYKKMDGDDRLIINSLGEGGIWVCNINGDLENGDYITTCEIPGYGMKQDDDILHNYTVAKITCECNFDMNSLTYRCEEFEYDGALYRRAFVGCTYHCG